MKRSSPSMTVLAVMGTVLVLSACTVTHVPEPWPSSRTTVVVHPGLYACSLGQVGVTVDDGLVVIGLVRGGPAWRAGIRLGDEVVSVAGQRVSTIAEAQRLGVGWPGTLVNLTVYRPDVRGYRSYTVTRACLP